ncbi:Zn-ribbon domain-containing OB-fold protein [Geodermatophilus sabuli]|uniref:Uncharacterized OB-fold protein, contains Zn-ribbon domain n=1 Tax=Geodermatophilus sabuli TaxID=1564158 RepID=A0A285EAM8_9ACTN|nr:zinc ribbon domain-containing protein [Geodermatophilus sabuli]MBB3085531.1 putative OB-fold protein [Geodermatophilus sabuli]SNX96047.1 Uncharacterized OB-fold protein, contains Zn-ribbon domain [Geodermatophilus sabuli]
MTIDGGAPDPFALERVDAAPGPAPHVHPDIAGFWDSLREGHLSLQRCSECRTLRFPLSTHCHVCLSGEYAWEPIDPRGTVNVAIRAHEAVSDLPASGVSLPEPWRGMTPYLTGAVDMPAGVRLPGRIVCTCGRALRPGTPVRAVLLEAADGATTYGFAHACP